MTAEYQSIYYRETLKERSPYSQEEVLSYVTCLANEREYAIVEGSPIYLFPDAERYESQGWTHPAFTQGWKFVNALTEQFEEQQLQHALLLDDFNNVSDGYDIDGIDEKMDRLRHHEVMGESILFDENYPEERVLFRFETDYTRDGDTAFNVCSNLDAGFQKEKILFSLEQEHDLLTSLKQTLLLVVHPTDFQAQQVMMLQSLLREMKQPPFASIPKATRRDLLSHMYRHIWFGEAGMIESITRPVWKSNTFSHEEVIIS